MKKKLKLALNESLDKALEPPRKAKRQNLDFLLAEYSDPVDNLDAQKEQIGRPKAKSLGVLTPKIETRTPKEAPVLDAKTPKENDLDAQKEQTSGKWTKYEKRRQTARLSLRPSAANLKEIKKFAIDRSLDLTEVTELAWRHLLDAQTSADLGVLTPLNNKELIMWKTKPHIINLYCSVTNKKWKMHDDKAATRFNETDPRVIELGILQTLGNAPKAKINSFAYFAPEIETWIEASLPDESIETVLKVLRNKKIV